MADRFISVKEFDEYLKKHIDEHNNCSDPIYKELTDGYYDGVCACRAALLEFKSADVQPVKHGKWLKRMSTSDSLKCSVCGNSHECKTAFCPHCGADMRQAKGVNDE